MSQSKEEYNAYQKVYQLKRYHLRRNKAIEDLGGKCVQCGSIEHLELDHIDPLTKTLNIAKLWSVAIDLYEKEISKCQLLCNECHILKSIEDNGHNVAKGTHGTLSSYRYCKCDLCKAAKAEYMKNYSKRYRR